MNSSHIVTSQYVSVTQALANVGERMMARTIDMSIIVAYVVGILMMEQQFTRGVGDWYHWFYSPIRLLILLPAVFYSLLFELLNRGQSPGKMLLKLRVVMRDGSQPTMGALLLRWLFLLIDVNTGFLGVLVMIFSKDGQRLGDMAAGTLVIKTNAWEQVQVSLDEFNYGRKNYVPVYAEARNLSLGQIDLIEKMLRTWDADNEEQLHTLAVKVEKFLQLKQRREQSDSGFLTRILHDYQYYATELI